MSRPLIRGRSPLRCRGSGHRDAIALSDGTVLAFGASAVDSDRYDPTSDTWQVTSAAPQLRPLVGATLTDGDALLVDEAGRATLYDPVSDSYSLTMATGLTSQPVSVLPLPNGNAVVTQRPGFPAWDLGVLFQARTRTWTELRKLPEGSPTWNGGVQVLPSGKLFVLASGANGKVAWTYDFGTATWTSMAPPRVNVQDYPLPFTTSSGELNFAGSLYDPRTDSWRSAPLTDWPSGPWRFAPVNGSDVLASPRGGRARLYLGEVDVWKEIPGPTTSRMWQSSVVVPLRDGGALALGAEEYGSLRETARYLPDHVAPAADPAPARAADVLAVTTRTTYYEGEEVNVHVRAVVRDQRTHDPLAGVTTEVWQWTAQGYHHRETKTTGGRGAVDFALPSGPNFEHFVVIVPRVPGMRQGASTPVGRTKGSGNDGPSPPVGVVAVRGHEDDRTRISWVSPEHDGSSRITAYEYSPVYGGLPEASVSGTSRTMVLDKGVSSGWLRAVNASGPGFWARWDARDHTRAEEEPSDLCGRQTARRELGPGTYRLCRSGLYLEPGSALVLDGSLGPVSLFGGPLTGRAAELRTRGDVKLHMELALSGLGQLVMDGGSVSGVAAEGLSEVRLSGSEAGFLSTDDTATWVSGSQVGRITTTCPRQDCEARVTSSSVGGVDIEGSHRVTLRDVRAGRTAWPVTLRSARYSLGPGGDIDGVTGPGQGTRAMRLSGVVTGELTWKDVPEETRGDVALGYVVEDLHVVGDLTVPRSTAVSFMRCPTWCRGLTVSGSLRAEPGSSFGGTSSDRVAPKASVVVRAPGSASLVSSRVHGDFKTESHATSSFVDTDFEGGAGLAVYGNPTYNNTPPPLPHVTVTGARVTGGASVVIVNARSDVSGLSIDGGTLTIGGSGTTRTTGVDIQRGSFRMDLTRGSTVKGVRVRGSTGPAGLLALDKVSLGPGQDVDGLVGSANAENSVGISGEIPNRLQWISPAQSDSTDVPLGYVIAKDVTFTSDLVLPPGALVQASGMLKVSGADLEATAGGITFQAFPKAYCEVVWCQEPEPRFFMVVHYGDVRMDDATVVGAGVSLLYGGRLSVTNSTVGGVHWTGSDSRPSSATVRNNIVHGRISLHGDTAEVVGNTVRSRLLPGSKDVRAGIEIIDQGHVYNSMDGISPSDVKVIGNTVSGSPLGIHLLGVRTTVGPGQAIDGNFGSGNLRNAILLEHSVLDSDLTWVPVPQDDVLRPFGHIAQKVDVRGHDVIVPFDTEVRASQLSILGGVLDAGAGLATFRGADTAEASIRASSDDNRAGGAVLRRASFTGSLHTGGTDAREGQLVLEQTVVKGPVSASELTTTITDSQLSSLFVDGSLNTWGQQDSPTRVTNSRLGGPGRTALSAEHTEQLSLDRLELRNSDVGLGLRRASGSLTCLNIVDNKWYGVELSFGESSLSSSNLSSTSGLEVGGRGSLATEDVWWGQSGGPQAGQVEDEGDVHVEDTRPRDTPTTCAGADPRTIPGRPDGLALTTASESITAQWRVPTAGAQVTGFEAIVRNQAGDVVASQRVGPTVTRVVFAKLFEGPRYHVRVRALGHHGSGASAATSLVLPMTAVPSQVYGVRVASTSGGPRVSWTNPGDAVWTATRVAVRPVGSSSTPTVVSDAPTTTAVLKGLAANTAYDVLISAHDVAGRSTDPVVVRIHGMRTSVHVDRASVTDGASVGATIGLQRDDGQPLPGRLVVVTGTTDTQRVPLGKCITGSGGTCRVTFTPSRNLAVTATSSASGSFTAAMVGEAGLAVTPRVWATVGQTAYPRYAKARVSVAVRTAQPGHTVQLQFWDGRSWRPHGHAVQDAAGRATIVMSVRPGRQSYRVVVGPSASFSKGFSSAFVVTGK